MIRRSWLTQRLANRFPEWSNARELPFSFLQQLLNPVASALQDVYKTVSGESKNFFLGSANMDTPDVVHTLRLPSTFIFGMDKTNIKNPRYLAPDVSVIEDGETVYIEAAPDNSFKTFWINALPTRIKDSSFSMNGAEVVEEIDLIDIEDATIRSIAAPNRLMITLTDNDGLNDLSKRVGIAFLVLTGMTVRGIEETETILIPYGGVFRTFKIWKELTKIELYCPTVPTGKIKIECLDFNALRYTDRDQLGVFVTGEKVLNYKLTTKSFDDEEQYSVLQFCSVITDSISDLYSGSSDVQETYEVELLYNNNNLLVYDMIQQPFTNRIFAIDDTFLYIFEPFTEQPNYKKLSRRTVLAQLVIDCDAYDTVRGQSIDIFPRWKTQGKRIVRNRWSVEKPDGTMTYINHFGEETLNPDVWIYNKTYTELLFGPFIVDGVEITKQGFSFIFSQRGTYKLKLETVYVDRSLEVDIVPIQVHSQNAIKRIRLPDSLQNSLGIAFDYNQKLWFLRSGVDYDYNYEHGGSPHIHKAQLVVDNMMVDFENKIIYLHEEYANEVSVEETPDLIVEK